jgi:hypothetical protein
VQVIAAENYTGSSPDKPGVAAPQYLSFYPDALTANGIVFDVDDLDAQGAMIDRAADELLTEHCRSSGSDTAIYRLLRSVLDAHSQGLP